ncbi:hypothetical protein VTK56DRAFT_1334 [Thermocarpiscus australiensis]
MQVAPTLICLTEQPHSRKVARDSKVGTAQAAFSALNPLRPIYFNSFPFLFSFRTSVSPRWTGLQGPAQLFLIPRAVQVHLGAVQLPADVPAAELDRVASQSIVDDNAVVSPVVSEG